MRTQTAKKLSPVSNQFNSALGNAKRQTCLAHQREKTAGTGCLDGRNIPVPAATVAIGRPWNVLVRMRLDRGDLVKRPLFCGAPKYQTTDHSKPVPVPHSPRRIEYALRAFWH